MDDPDYPPRPMTGNDMLLASLGIAIVFLSVCAGVALVLKQL